jgi:hypothetical protein
VSGLDIHLTLCGLLAPKVSSSRVVVNNIGLQQGGLAVDLVRPHACNHCSHTQGESNVSRYKLEMQPLLRAAFPSSLCRLMPSGRGPTLLQDITLKVENRNMYDLVFEPMNITFFFPESPERSIGKWLYRPLGGLESSALMEALSLAVSEWVGWPR